MEELIDIADQINALIVGNQTNKDIFCEHIIKVIAEAEKYGQYLHNEWQKAKRSKLSEKTKRPELMQYDESRDEGKWTWWTANMNDWAHGKSVYFSGIFENNKYVAFYIEGKPKSDPLAYLYSMIWGSVGQVYKGFELLDYQFILLAIIHDVQNWQAGRERIYFNPLQDNTLPDRLCRAAWRTLEEQRDSGRVQQTIKTALRGVKAELDKTTSSGKAGDEKKRKKTPPQLLKETRERQAAKELTSNPNITCTELGKKLGCDKSTAIRLEAWKKRGVLFSELKDGIINRQKDNSVDVDGVVEPEEPQE